MDLILDLPPMSKVDLNRDVEVVEESITTI